MQDRRWVFNSPSVHHFCSQVAQLAERTAVNRQVVGAKPTLGANLWERLLTGEATRLSRGKYGIMARRSYQYPRLAGPDYESEEP